MSSVSVVMCTYNGERYLRPQLDSILAQALQADEIIIQDDGSTDSTCEIVREYQAKHPEIVLIRNEAQLGPNVNFLTGIQRAKGDFIALSDQDDIWELDKIESIVARMQETGCALGFCRSKEFCEEGTIEVFYDPRTPNFSIERAIFGDSMAPGHTMVIRRSFVSELTLERYDTCPGEGHDGFILLMAAAHESICLCDRILVHYRRHPSQASALGDRSFTFKTGPVKMLRVALKTYLSKKKEMTDFFGVKYRFLSALPLHNEGLDNALRLAWLFSHRGFFNYIRLTLLCVRLRRKIFFTAQIAPLTLLLRSFFFPLYCATYFRD